MILCNTAFCSSHSHGPKTTLICLYNSIQYGYPSLKLMINQWLGLDLLVWFVLLASTEGLTFSCSNITTATTYFKIRKIQFLIPPEFMYNNITHCYNNMYIPIFANSNNILYKNIISLL